MTLKELSIQYEAAAQPIRERLRELRGQLAQTNDPDGIWHLKRRIAELTPMLTQMNDLAWMLAHYYERGGGNRDDRFGFNGKRRIRKKKTPNAGTGTHYSGGAYGASTPDFPGIPLSRFEFSPDCNSSRGRQKHRKSHVEESGAENLQNYEVPLIFSDALIDGLWGENPKRYRRIT